MKHQTSDLIIKKLQLNGGQYSVDQKTNETVVILQNGKEIQLNLHDYQELYSIKGLYEDIFINRLCYSSHEKLANYISSAVVNKDRKILEVGSGNGLFGNLLKKRGFLRIHGVDFSPSAQLSAERDYPNTYNKYSCLDIRNNCKNEITDVDLITCNASLGFEDIPVISFVDLCKKMRNVEDVIFTVHTDIEITSPFRHLTDFNLVFQETVFHRKHVTGASIYYNLFHYSRCKSP